MLVTILCGLSVIMLLTLLSQFFGRSNTTGGSGSSVTVKIFLYCSIPTFFLSSGLTLFISSFSIAKVTFVQTTQNFTLSDQLSVKLQIRFPLPDSYVEVIKLKWQDNTDLRWYGKDVCYMKSSLNKCLNFTENKNCHLKETENKALFDLLEKIVLC